MDNFPYNRAGRGQAVLPPTPKAPTASFDEWGTPYDAQGNSLAEPSSLGVNALTALAAPVNIGLALMGALSPYDGTEGGEGWRVPPIISEPAAAFARSGESTGFGDDGQFYLPNVQNPQVAQDTLTQLMTVYGGNALNPLARVPKGAVASGAVKQAADALPMDQASRLARARDMGFDTDTTWYHGTPRKFDAFQPGTHGAVFFSPDQNVARDYSGYTGNTVDAHLRYRNPLIVDKSKDARLPRDILADVDRSQYDAVIFENMMDRGSTQPQTQIAVFDPSNIRSTNAAFDPARAGENGLLLSDNRPSLMGSALASGQGEARGITAYHGSPHDFDRFDLSKIGTGEGAQAYGHGLYFAENEGVAKSYRDNLGGGDLYIKGEKQPFVGAGYAQDTVNRQLMRNHGNVEETLNWLNGEIDTLQRRGVDAETLGEFLAARDNLSTAANENAVKFDQGGKMYQVRINANPEDFLDWDKPLSEQPANVRNAISQAAYGEVLPDWNGMEAFRSVGSQMFGEPDVMNPEIAKRVREAGIPGIKYLDQMSRDAGQGSRNYVVFDDSLIEILKKYGWLAPGAMYGSNDIDQQNQQQPY